MNQQKIGNLGNLTGCKGRDSFENDVIPSLEERKEMRNLLSKHKHSKLVLITE